jgi:hypothetical protein
MFRFRSGGPLAVAAFIGVVLAIKFFGPELISRLASNSSTGPPSASNPNGPWGEQKDYARQPDPKQNQKDSSSGFPEPSDIWPSNDHLMLTAEITFGVIFFIVLLWAGLRLYQHYGRPTDPTKYVMSDPWIQAHLEGRAVSSDRPEQPSA